MGDRCGGAGVAYVRGVWEKAEKWRGAGTDVGKGRNKHSEPNNEEMGMETMKKID